jgi:hypothetical protein
VVGEIFAMYLEDGESLFGLSRKLKARGIPSPRGRKIWTVSTLRGILTNPVYTGRIYAGRMSYRPPRIRRSATHPIGRSHDTGIPAPPAEWTFVSSAPSIVSQEHFDLVKEKLSKNKSFARRNNKNNTYLLRALVSCGRCELSCIARTVNCKNKYYVCSGKGKQIHTGREKKCPSRFAPADQLDELVWKDLCEVLTHPKSITEALQRAHGGHWLPQELRARRENLRAGRAALKRQLERLTEAYLAEIIPLAEYERRRRDLEQREEALASQERQLQTQADKRMELAGVASSIEDFCARVRGSLENATFEQKRQLVELLIDRVIVTDGEVEIRYVIPTSPSSEKIRFCHLRSDYLGDPGLVEPVELCVLDEVGVDPEGMSRVGGRHKTAPDLTQKRLLSHDPQDSLVVYGPASPVKLGGDPTVAVARELQDNVLYDIPQIEVLARLLFGCRGLLVVPGAAHRKRTAQLAKRDLRMILFEGGDHGVPPFEWYFESPFFRSSFSKESLPQKRSSSAILSSRASSLEEACLSVKASSPQASYSLRHLKSTLSERLCSRQIWAGRLWPVATCRQHSSLNSLVCFLLNPSSLRSGCNSTSDHWRS